MTRYNDKSIFVINQGADSAIFGTLGEYPMLGVRRFKNYASAGWTATMKGLTATKGVWFRIVYSILAGFRDEIDWGLVEKIKIGEMDVEAISAMFDERQPGYKSVDHLEED
jgi:hypothetical protein